MTVEVKAFRKGFYNSRRKVGEKFHVEDPADVASFASPVAADSVSFDSRAAVAAAEKIAEERDAAAYARGDRERTARERASSVNAEGDDEGSGLV